jgi:membrane-bound ClpP family serine protease
MADWNDILSNHNGRVSDEELLKYLVEEMSVEEKLAIEKRIAEDPFEADAVEGLTSVENKDNLPNSVKQLNQKLQQQLFTKRRREKRTVKLFEWMILAIVILLFVCIATYLIILIQNKAAGHTQIDFLIRPLQAVTV